MISSAGSGIPTEAPWIDSHCHLDMLPGWGRDAADASLADQSRIDAEIDELLLRARAAGVGRMIAASCRPDEVPGLLRLLDRVPGLWSAFGLHPHEAKDWGPEVAALLERALAHPKAVAVGECGLDYHYDHSPRELQQEAFAAQLRLAARLDKPVVIHTRLAEDDTLRILDDVGLPARGGVLHCFTGTMSMARAAVERGLHVSFSGIVTFPKAGELREVAAWVPEARLLVETDAPFLAPPPYRGKRNEPAWVVRVLEVLAELRGTTVEALGAATARNATELYRLG
ncbi:MAG: TatD family hydrolase [Candidatus Sericytochromatia bacterium]|nr:TatD family hydrolase [Candidatus Sericytochromatia bacterium]